MINFWYILFVDDLTYNLRILVQSFAAPEGPAYKLEMCMGMGFPMGPGIPWESHGNGNKTQKWEWECEGMGNHLSGNGNYLHSHGNLFPKVLC